MPEIKFAVAKCVKVLGQRTWLESQPCASVEDGKIIVQHYLAMSGAWAVLAVMALNDRGEWKTVHYWQCDDGPKRTLH